MTKQEKLNWITEYIHDNGWQDVYIEEFAEILKKSFDDIIVIQKM